MTFEVALARCGSYDPAAVAAAVEEAVAPFGGFSAFAGRGDRVLLKLNLLAAKAPEDAVTTHPALVREVIKRVQDCGAEVLVGDSPGGRNTPAKYRALLKKTGILDVIESSGARAVYFDDPVTTVASEKARTFKKFTVTSVVHDVDAVIALPKCKTHQFTTYTGAVKLLYGYIPGVRKAEYHLHAGRDVAWFAELLLDLCKTFPPALTIMDAVVGMDGPGPQSGTPRPIGLILAGTNAPAIDFVATQVLGLDPASVPTVRIAAERGYGPASLGEVTVHGPHPDTVRVEGFVPPVIRTMDRRLPPVIVPVLDRLLATRPAVDTGRCV
ncbi:MAG: DUF362 domain-containing protein, partial [Methanomicrobiales archaeon]|nr:DUF362 domain-containing protein [Methanomicrobiales archaeon]